MHTTTYLKTIDCPEDNTPHWVDSNAPYAIGKKVELTTLLKSEVIV